MSREELLERLQSIFADVFDDENIQLTEETGSEDIEAWDSLANISILAAVQDEFSVKLDMSEVVAIKNVGGIIEAILRKL